MEQLKLLLVISLLSIFSYAQENQGLKNQNLENQNSWSMEVSGKLGVGTLTTRAYENLSGNVTASEVLLVYNAKRFSFGGGLGFLQFNSNVTAANQIFGLESSFLQIPGKVQYHGNLNPEPEQQIVSFVVGTGVVGTYHISESLTSYAEDIDRDYQGWQLGFIVETGLLFQVYDDLSAGIFLEGLINPEQGLLNDDIILNSNMVKFNFQYNY